MGISVKGTPLGEPAKGVHKLRTAGEGVSSLFACFHSLLVSAFGGHWGTTFGWPSTAAVMVCCPATKSSSSLLQGNEVERSSPAVVGDTVVVVTTGRGVVGGRALRSLRCSVRCCKAVCDKDKQAPNKVILTAPGTASQGQPPGSDRV